MIKLTDKERAHVVKAAEQIVSQWRHLANRNEYKQSCWVADALGQIETMFATEPGVATIQCWPQVASGAAAGRDMWDRLDQFEGDDHDLALAIITGQLQACQEATP